MRAPGSSLLLFPVLCTALLAQPDPAVQFRQHYGEAVAAMQDPDATAAERRRLFGTALSQFLKIPDDHRDYPGLLLAGAFCATQVQRHSLAVQLLERSWTAGNQNAENLQAYLRAHLAQDDPVAAVRLAYGQRRQHRAVVRGILVAPDLMSRWWPGADQLMRRGETAAGIWVFRVQGELLARDPFVQANLGLALRQLGELEAAQKAYQRALALEPAPWIANDLGLLLKGWGRPQEAARTLVRSLGLQKVRGEGAAGTNLAVLVQRTGVSLRPEPLADLQDVLRRRPDAAMARRLTLDVLARKHPVLKTALGGRDRRPEE